MVARTVTDSVLYTGHLSGHASKPATDGVLFQLSSGPWHVSAAQLWHDGGPGRCAPRSAVARAQGGGGDVVVQPRQGGRVVAAKHLRSPAAIALRGLVSSAANLKPKNLAAWPGGRCAEWACEPAQHPSAMKQGSKGAEPTLLVNLARRPLAPVVHADGHEVLAGGASMTAGQACYRSRLGGEGEA